MTETGPYSDDLLKTFLVYFITQSNLKNQSESILEHAGKYLAPGVKRILKPRTI